jgi:hypothetical protein
MKTNKVTLFLILLSLLFIIVIIVFLYNSVWKESPLIDDFNSCKAIKGSTVMETSPRQCSFEGNIFIDEPLINKQAKVYCDLENVAKVDICGNYTAVSSSLLGGGITYHRQDGTSFSCPVVGPDSMSPECKQIFEMKLNEELICRNIC